MSTMAFAPRALLAATNPQLRPPRASTVHKDTTPIDLLRWPAKHAPSVSTRSLQLHPRARPAQSELISIKLRQKQRAKCVLLVGIKVLWGVPCARPAQLDFMLPPLRKHTAHSARWGLTRIKLRPPFPAKYVCQVPTKMQRAAPPANFAHLARNWWLPLLRSTTTSFPTARIVGSCSLIHLKGMPKNVTFV